jgi:hypothetical protein
MLIVAGAVSLTATAPGWTQVRRSAASGSRKLQQRPTARASRRLTRVPQGFVGMEVDGPMFPDTNNHVALGHQLDVMVASGVETIRVTFDWASAQPYESWNEVPAAQTDQFVDVGGIPTRFVALDQIVALAAQRQLTILPTVLNAPRWDGESHPGQAVSMPKSGYWYGNFLAGLAARYGPSGTYWSSNKPRFPIHMWQIWNEPNLIPFWSVQPFAPSYVALLRAARSAVKAVDPSARIVLAGMPNASWVALAQIYKIAGARELFDAVAIHPYTRQPDGVITILRYVRRVMNKVGDRRKPILADEVSWPSSLGKTFHNAGLDFATTEAGQARNIAAVLPMLARARKRLGLQGFYYYTWAGYERRNAVAFEFSGLFRYRAGELFAKPAYRAFRRAALALEHCRKKRVVTGCAHRG